MADDKKQNPTPEGRKPEAPAPDVPSGPPSQKQATIPGMDGSGPAAGKVINLSDVQADADKDKAAGPDKAGPPVPETGKQAEKPPTEKTAPQADKPGRGRPPKAEKAAKAQPAPEKKGKAAPAKAPAEKADPPAPEEPPAPRDATRAEKEEIVYLNLSDLHPFKNHPFGVRDDDEMKSLVESVQKGGVNQPALVRPREGGGYEIIAGHRRQMASQLAGYRNMPCIVRSILTVKGQGRKRGGN